METPKETEMDSAPSDVVDEEDTNSERANDTVNADTDSLKSNSETQFQCTEVQDDMDKMNLEDEDSHGSMNLVIDEKAEETVESNESVHQDAATDTNSNSIQNNDVEMTEEINTEVSTKESGNAENSPGEDDKSTTEQFDNEIEIVEKSITVIDLDDEEIEKESVTSKDSKTDRNCDSPEQIGIILESEDAITHTESSCIMPHLEDNTTACHYQSKLESTISDAMETDAHMSEGNGVSNETSPIALKKNEENEDTETEVLFFGKECLNYECKGECTRYFRAPEFVLNCYKVGKKVGKTQFVCESCYDKACVIYEEFAGLLQNKQPMLLKNFSFHKQEFVEIDSSDEEVDEEGSDKEHFDDDTLNLMERELENTIKSVLTKVEIQNQLTWSKTLLNNRLDKLEEDTLAVASNVRSLQQKADKMHMSLYRWSKSRVQQEPPLDLNTGRAYVLKGSDLPPVGEVKRSPIKVNEIYFAVKNKPIASWVPCKVIEEIDSSQSNVKLYKVKFLRSQYQLLKTVPAKHLAYPDPPPVRLPVGSRVIAYFDASLLSRGKEKLNIQSAYYPGIIAEPLKFGNNFRYLIFYDDGYTQYVYHKDVRLVCHASDNVWEDVHSGSREFIQKYLTEYLINRPMVQTSKGQTILTESNGKWLNARVLEIDDSLILLQFDGTRSHTEWIYRGSMRLGPVYREYQQKNSLPVARTPRRTETFISYEQDDDSSSRQRKEAPASRAVAKKSVSRPSDRNVSSSTSSSGSQTVCLNSSTIYVDDDNKPRGKVVFYTAVRNKPPCTYTPHNCSPRCLFEVPYNLNGYSPLAKPLLSGWERMIYKQRSKKIVTYRGPCGRVLRNMKDIHRYLRETENVLNVDNFDFSSDINCLAEYVIENATVKRRDISGGQEKMAIPLVNYYDNSMPPACKYSAQRIPTEGVNLNLDQEFLVGCDCEDDCSDKSKCSCWQLTLEGAKYGNPNTPIDEVGYQYRRLLEHVPTGIYECNPRCKCKSNCLNRVVQNFLQIKLQVFKTSNRGWGLRCLNDIPKGCFVCIYAGYLLTEAKANEGGKEIGDEYFAELDYIETAEQVKEGYESEVESSDPEDDEDSAANEKDFDDDDFTPSKSFVSRPKKAQRLTRSSNIHSEDDSQERQVINFNPNSDMNDDNQKDSSMRKLFGKDEHCYVMDAKITGNLGRYFNHSCAPNLFVQNVFVDTHDLRFPWVAFFAASNIRAGTELTWNYNYEVGVVPGKVLYCQCGAPNCRVRLL